MSEPEDDAAAPDDAAEGARSPTVSTGSGDSPTFTLESEAGGKTFAAGEIAAGRYRVLRFISQGAMGEVYEAFDQELRERVALKTLRPEITQDERAMERFRREVQVARRVTHPNVCRVFDVFKHNEATFLTMELLEGETLADRLRRERRLEATAALPLVAQIAAGLDAAHAAGVVHRDFKSSNIVLVPLASAPGGTRAVITDFGLARAETRPESDPALTSTGALVGTPAYMAPEQVEASTVTAAADIYAFGVVLFEMLTGTRPFTGSTAMSVALKRLKEAPPTPRQFVPELDQRWETSVLRCLARDPAARFARASDVLEAMRAPSSWIEQGLRRRRLRTGVAVLALASAVLFFASLQEPLLVKSVPPLTKLRPVVAVLGIKNVSGRPDVAWLGTAIAEMLTTELASGEKLRLIPGEDVARMKMELSLRDAESFGKGTLSLIRSNVGADLVIHGSYTALGNDDSGPLRLDVRLQDARDGETLASIAESGQSAELRAVSISVRQPGSAFSERAPRC